MTKKQKIWFIVFVAMFLVPLAAWVFGTRGSVEIPWLPTISLGYFLDIVIACCMVLSPLIGLTGIFWIIKKISINKKFKIFIFIILIPLICFFVFLNFMFFWIMFYYMLMSPQIG